MTSPQNFEWAAAIAGVCVGLGAVSLFCLVAVVWAWQTFRRASESATAAARAALSMEELARRVSEQAGSQARREEGQIGGLRREAESLLEQERRLQEMSREVIESGALEGGPSAAALSELELAVGRLDATVGQMAASLANLVQLLERQR